MFIRTSTHRQIVEDLKQAASKPVPKPLLLRRFEIKFKNGRKITTEGHFVRHKDENGFSIKRVDSNGDERSAAWYKDEVVEFTSTWL